MKTGINVKYDNPKEVGADRIVNAVAAREIYRKPLIIIDLNSYHLVLLLRTGDYLGGQYVQG